MVKILVAFLTRFIPRTMLQRVAHIGLQSISWFYFGNKLEDPIDGKTYRRILPYGRVRTRHNALAPFSLSLERHRALWIYMKESTNFFTHEAKMLHMAPEYCFIKRLRALENLEYITGDLDSPWADHHFDVHQIPFDDSSFDIIMANHLMEHVDDDRAVLREFYRVLKPGGWGILQVPIDWTNPSTEEDRSITDPAELERLYWQRDHLRLYGFEDYPARLRQAGFSVEIVDMKKQLGNQLYDRYALGGEQWIFVVRK
ncbi:MAG TPA: SAM-dependent methyltransferase [Flavobacteriales bacterium]|nr:SAM-dependent methyltransferase [Flavobacteriales bacterium]